MLFICKNTIFEKRPASERKGIGIANNRQRLQHIYPNKHRLDISVADGNFIVELEINA